jgi:PAS domain S-box-containing protein
MTMTDLRLSSTASERCLELSEDVACVIDEGLVVLHVNTACQRVLGWTQVELVGSSVLDRLHPEDVETVRARASLAMETDQFEGAEVRCRHADGSWRRLSWLGVYELGSWTCLGHDLTGREQAAGHRERTDALLRALPDGLATVDCSGRITMASERLCEVTGFSVEELVGSFPPYPFWPAEHADHHRASLDAAIGGADGNYEVVFCRKSGERFPATVKTAPLGEFGGEPCAFIAVIRDVTNEVREREELREAHVNERAITSSIGQGLYTIDRAGRLLYLNPAAEALLGWHHEELIGQVMHDVVHLQRADGTPLAVGDCPLHDVGRHGRVVRTEGEVFVRKDRSVFPIEATVAPLGRGEAPRGYVVVFSDISERKAEEARLREQTDKMSWLRNVRDALAHDRFVLHAQPIIALVDGTTTQHELLIRMLGPTGKLVPPGRFLPPAEEYGLIVDIDRWVIRQAAEIAARGHHVELNLSAHSFGTARLSDKFEDVLRRTGADPALMTIELTETALVKDEQAATAFIERVKALGCKLALDDFGTGYASFTYLKRLPIDYLKIDAEFIRDVVDNHASQHVVKAVVNLAKDFGQQTIAEGVEDERTLDLVRELGVDFAQGYYIGRPGPLDTAGLLMTGDESRRLTA